MPRCLPVFLLILIGISHSGLAQPPLVYESALRWSDKTVTSDIPLRQRIYILGPDKVRETYTLDGKPAQHSVEVRRAVAAEYGLTLAQVIATSPRDRAKDFWVDIYRKMTPDNSDTIMPFFRAMGKNALASQFLLQARDVIVVGYPRVSPSGERVPEI